MSITNINWTQVPRRPGPHRCQGGLGQQPVPHGSEGLLATIPHVRGTCVTELTLKHFLERVKEWIFQTFGLFSHWKPLNSAVVAPKQPRTHDCGLFQ